MFLFKVIAKLREQLREKCSMEEQSITAASASSSHSNELEGNGAHHQQLQQQNESRRAEARYIECKSKLKEALRLVKDYEAMLKQIESAQLVLKVQLQTSDDECRQMRHYCSSLESQFHAQLAMMDAMKRQIVELKEKRRNGGNPSTTDAAATVDGGSDDGRQPLRLFEKISNEDDERNTATSSSPVSIACAGNTCSSSSEGDTSDADSGFLLSSASSTGCAPSRHGGMSFQYCMLLRKFYITD